jgi:DNA-binding MltR family transcriptional regulator
MKKSEITTELEDENGAKSIKSFYNNLLRQEFEKETDRGAVILAASLFEINLESLLKTFLVPDISRSDDLFEGATAPLSNFSSKILMSYRLGLISKNFARDLNLVRRIRNEFAHNIHGCSFDHSSVKSRVNELAKSSNITTKAPTVRKGMSTGTRGDFLICASWMLWSLSTEIDGLKTLNEAELEFGYSEVNEELINERNKKDNKSDKE